MKFESAKNAERKFPITLNLPFEAGQKVWIVQKFHAISEESKCPCCDGTGSITGTDNVKYDCKASGRRWSCWRGVKQVRLPKDFKVYEAEMVRIYGGVWRRDLQATRLSVRLEWKEGENSHPQSDFELREVFLEKKEADKVCQDRKGQARLAAGVPEGAEG